MTPDRPEKPGMFRRLFSYWREIMIISLLLFSVSCLNKIKADEEEQLEERIKVNEHVEFIDHNWPGVDALSFKEAFSQMYTEYGPGHVFDWRGNVFLTKLAE